MAKVKTLANSTHYQGKTYKLGEIIEVSQEEAEQLVALEVGALVEEEAEGKEDPWLKQGKDVDDAKQAGKES